MAKIMLGNHECGIRNGEAVGLFIGTDSQPAIPYTPPYHPFVQDGPFRIVDNGMKILLNEPIDAEGNTLATLYPDKFTQDILINTDQGGVSYPEGTARRQITPWGDGFSLRATDIDFDIRFQIMGTAMGAKEQSTKVTARVDAYSSVGVYMIYHIGSSYPYTQLWNDEFRDIRSEIPDRDPPLSFCKSRTSYGGSWDIGDKTYFRKYLNPETIFKPGFKTLIWLPQTKGSSTCNLTTTLHFKDGTTYTPDTSEEYELTPSIVANLDYVEEIQVVTSTSASGNLTANHSSVTHELNVDQLSLLLSYDSYSDMFMVDYDSYGSGFMTPTLAYANCSRDPETGFHKIESFSKTPRYIVI